MKTSELSGVQLDYAVAQIERTHLDLRNNRQGAADVYWLVDHMGRFSAYFHPSTDWSLAGPIIERECIELMAFDAASTVPKDPMYWQGTIYEHDGECSAQGPTPLIAAMRCYVKSKLGEAVDIPEELI